MGTSRARPKGRSGKGGKGGRGGIWLARTAGTLALLAGTGGLLAYLADRHWTLDLLAHFRLQYLLALLLSGLLFLALRHPALAGLAAAGAVAAGAPLVAHRLVQDVRCPSLEPELRILSLDVGRENPGRAAVARWIRSEGAEVVFLMAVDAGWEEALASELGADYPHRVVEAREDDFGVALLSRTPFLEGAVVFLATSVPSVVARLSREDGDWTVIGTHAAPPANQEAARRRDLQLEALAARVRAAREPTVVVGDLATTPWAASFRALLASAGLHDGGEGSWPQGTWGGRAAPLGLLVDHALVSDGLCVVERRLGPHLGASHRPLTAEVGRRQAP